MNLPGKRQGKLFVTLEFLIPGTEHPSPINQKFLVCPTIFVFYYVHILDIVQLDGYFQVVVKRCLPGFEMIIVFQRFGIEAMPVFMGDVPASAK